MFPMAPMNNPVLALVQAMQRGGNPVALIQQMAQQNPQAAQAVRMMQGKSPQQLQQMAQNMARERGVDLNQMLRDLGINNASYR